LAMPIHTLAGSPPATTADHRRTDATEADAGE